MKKYPKLIPIEFAESNIGKIIKSTKKRLTWKFSLGKDTHQIDLLISRVSGKRRVYLEGSIFGRYSKIQDFLGRYPVQINDYTLILFETSENKFDLRFGEFSFSDPLNYAPIYITHEKSHFDEPVVPIRRHQTEKQIRTLKIRENLNINLNPKNPFDSYCNPFNEIDQKETFKTEEKSRIPKAQASQKNLNIFDD